jgi:predicted N-acetyltransferase YhbS
MHVERLADRHRLDNFDSGTKALDHWLVRHALENQQRDLSRTFVLVDDGGEVVGYYSLTMGGVRKDELPSSYGRGLPGYDIGMVLLARLAISLPHQGQGLGRDLLVDAIAHAVAAGRHAAARFVAVDPIDDRATSFYRAFGFRTVTGDEGGRMYLRIDHALQAFDDG